MPKPLFKLFNNEKYFPNKNASLSAYTKQEWKITLFLDLTALYFRLCMT